MGVEWPLPDDRVYFEFGCRRVLVHPDIGPLLGGDAGFGEVGFSDGLAVEPVTNILNRRCSRCRALRGAGDLSVDVLLLALDHHLGL